MTFGSSPKAIRRFPFLFLWAPNTYGLPISATQCIQLTLIAPNSGDERNYLETGLVTDEITEISAAIDARASSCGDVFHQAVGVKNELATAGQVIITRLTAAIHHIPCQCGA